MNDSLEKMSTTRSANGNSNAPNGLSSSPTTVPLQFDNISRASGSEFSLINSETEITPEKFSRLLFDYSKLRSQFGVLRKAYVEEKSKNQKYEEQIKQCEQDIRKFVQEAESLNFRNTQLSKRVGVLQNDLEENSNKSRGFFNFSTDTSVSTKHRTLSNASTVSAQNIVSGKIENELFEEINLELKNKMVENEQLKNQMDFLESKLSEENAIWAKKLKISTLEADEKINEQNGKISKLSNALNKVKLEKVDLETSLKNFKTKAEEEENSYKKQIDELKEQLRKKMAETISPTSSLLSVSDQTLPRSGSFSGDIHNRFTPVLPPRSGSLSIQNRTKNFRSNTASSKIEYRIPSHSSTAYQSEALRNQVVEEFNSKIYELICAFSTIHQSFAKKVSVLFAMFNNEEYHFYFDVKNSVNSLQNQNILRQLSQSLQSGYDTYLVHLEESKKQYVEALKKSYNIQNEEQEKQISAEMCKYANDILHEFNNYSNYLAKVSTLAVSCLNNWNKILKSFNSNAEDQDIPEELFEKLSNNEKRFDLIQKQELLAQNIQEFARIVSQIYGTIKLLFTHSLNSDRLMTSFNQCLQRVNSLEKCYDSFKQALVTKHALEHELQITSNPNMLESDDCLLSALVFGKTIITDIRVLMEVHYFFFVCPLSSNSSQGTKGRLTSPSSPMQSRLIPEEEEELPDADEELPEDDEELPEDDEELIEADEELPNAEEEKQKLFQKIQQKQRQIDLLTQEKEKYVLDIEHKTLLLERDSKRITELELKVQELLTQLDHKKESGNPKLNDQLSITSNASISASSIIDYFGVQYPINDSDDIDSFIKDLSDNKEFNKDQYWKGHLTQILNYFEQSCSKLAASQLECASLRQLYKQLDETKTLLEATIKSNKEELNSTQEKFDISVKNYQAQLQSLMDHSVLQNETIEAQRKEIEALVYEKSSANQNYLSNPKTTSSATSFVSKAFAGFKKS